jgi:hypothetical protein
MDVTNIHLPLTNNPSIVGALARRAIEWPE